MPVTNGIQSEPIRLRAAPSSCVVLTFPWLAFVAVILATARRSPGTWAAIVICVVMIVALVLWLSRFSLRLDDDGVTYTSLTVGRRSLAVGDIERYEAAYRRVSYADKFKPTVRLVIYPTPTSGKQAITVNTKVFRRRELARFCEKLDALLGDRGLRAR